MFPQTLAPEREVVVENVDAALRLLDTDFKIATEGASLASFRVREDGTLSWGGAAYPMTGAALEAVCRLVQLPLGFARTIPFDLLIQNFERLKDELDRRVILAISDDVVVNVIQAGRLGYWPARSRDVLERIPSLGLRLALRGLRLSVRGMIFSTAIPSFGVLEPQVGDITEVGLQLVNSESGFHGLKASFFLYRLVCSNGMVLGNAWGSVYWSYDPRMSYGRSLENFLQAVATMAPGINVLAAAYSGLLQQKVPADEAVDLWRRLARIVGKADADLIMGLTAVARRALFRDVRAGREGTHGGGDPHAETEWTWWEALNATTQAAQRHPFVRRQQLETLGGRLVDDVRRGLGGSSGAPGNVPAPAAIQNPGHHDT